MKRKDFATSSPLSDREITSPKFLDGLMESYRAMAPFVEFLSQAMELRF